MKYLTIISAFAVAVFITACGRLEKDINLDLPAYESQYVVDCYLEPGQPFSLLLTKSVPYFEPFPADPLDFVNQILADSAEVVISHNGTDYVLDNGAFFNPFTGKLFNYFNAALVPDGHDMDFTLKITTPGNMTITADTRILPVVPIDSVIVEFDGKADTLARVLTYLTDDPATKDYYRRMLHHNSLDSIPDQDFTTFDVFVDDNKIVFGSPFDYAVGDTVFTSIFHIDRAYFDFWESTFNAISANGNPFGQPSSIISNLSGDANALGIFTGLSYDRVAVVIDK